MPNTPIKFYSRAYEATGENSASTFSTNNAGAIVFDRTTHSIYVGGNQYGGSNLVDATFGNNVLTITKRDNSTVQLDFSSLATAESVMHAFQELHTEIDAIETGAGLGATGTYTADSTTNYLTQATSLKDADKKLDAQIKSVADEVDAIETGAGLGTDGTYTANSSANYIANATSLKDADNKLDTAVKNISDSLLDVTDFKYYINGTTPTTTTIRTITENSELKPVIDVTDAVAVANPLTTKTYVDNKVAALDGSATIASKSGDVVTLKAGLTEVDGVVSNNSGTDIVLEEVATTGAAADVSIADTGNKITATTVEGALAELADAITNTTVSVDSNEKIISMSNSNVLSSTLKIAIEKQGTRENQKDYIVLKGINDTEVAKVDASAFVLDGMLSSAELVTTAESGVEVTAPYIKLTFNTDAGQQPIRFSVSSLVDTYTSGNSTALTVSNYTITPNTGAVAENAGTLTTGGQVYTAIQDATNQIQTITGETATTQGDYVNVKVTATKGANDNNYTLSTTSNVTTQAVSTADASHMGLAEASDVKDYVDTQVGTAIQSVDGSSTENAKTVTASDYATVKVTATTDSSKNVTLDSAIGLTVQAMNSADSTHMGLAEASDVKSYVDTKANVVNESATIPVNSTTATTLATVGGTAITAQASFNWEVYE